MAKRSNPRPRAAARRRSAQGRAVERLAGAVAALDAGRDAEAIALLVEVWRERRSPQLADLIDLVDARQPERPYASLLAPRAEQSIERLEAVADHLDPRLSTAILAILAQPVFVARTPGFWRLVMTIAEAHADERLIDRAGGFATTLGGRLSPAALCSEIVARLRELPGAIVPARAPTAEEAALERQLASRLVKASAARDHEADLLDEIYADPAADGPRLVYADMLLERGDPYGELIALQFKRRDHGLSEAETARERTLLKKHIRTWLRGLAPVLSGTQRYSKTTFERGFVAIGDLQLSAGRRLPATWTERAWNTVEQLTGVVGLQREVLERAPLRGLRRIEHLTLEDLALLEHHDRFPNLDELEVVLRTDGAGERARLAAFAAVPKLRRLTIVQPAGYELPDVEWLFGTPLVARVERLVLHRFPIDPVAPARAAFDRLVEALATTRGPVRELALMPPWTRWPRPAPVELVRTERGYAPA